MNKKNNDGNASLAIVTGFLALSYLFKQPILSYVALGLGVGCLLFPAFQRGLVFVWEKIALALGRINSYVLLSLIFFLFLTPIALLMRLFAGKDNLRLKKPAGSNFFERNHTFQKNDLTNIW